MAHRYLRTLCFIISAAHLCVTDNSVCDDDWIYHPSSNTCLQITKGSVSPNTRQRAYDPCRMYSGGEYKNISGTLVDITDAVTPFLREYLRFQNVSYALAGIKAGWFSRIGFYVDGFHFLFGEGLIPILISAHLDNFLGILSYTYNGSMVCQVKAGIPSSERPSCPARVTIESLSDSSATLYLEPGAIRSKIRIKLTNTEKCPNPTSACAGTEDRIVHNVFLYKSMKYTVVGLKENTKYTVHFDVEDGGGEVFQCNETMGIRTEVSYITATICNPAEATLPVRGSSAAVTVPVSGSSAAVTGLSIVLAILICIGVVLGVLYCRILRKTREGFNSSSLLPLKKDRSGEEKTGTTDTTYSSSPYVNRTAVTARENDLKQKMELNLKQKMELNIVSHYGNVQPASHIYDRTSGCTDDHLYEK